MRFLCWCSAALVLLAGCGSKTAAPDPFAYDQHRPLAVHDAGVALSGPKVAVHVVTFEGARHVNAFLVVPRRAGPHPAVLFLHGSGGNREDLLLPAIELATRGAVTMTISQPNAASPSARSSSTHDVRSTCWPPAATSTRTSPGSSASRSAARPMRSLPATSRA